MPLNLLIVSTNVARNTQLLTGSIKALNHLYPAVVSPMFDSIDAISCEALDILKSNADITEAEYGYTIAFPFLTLQREDLKPSRN